MDNKILDIYKLLLKKHGKQYWWPVHSIREPKKGSSIDRSMHCSNNAFEIMVGAILTQNTNWSNAEKALDNLIKSDSLELKNIAHLPLARLEKLIKPSGFYKQKALRLRNFARFILKYKTLDNFCKNIGREQLLNQNGIGPETADSI
ncbi:MAG: endonuclease III domain-containing protein, partial [Candidatus Aenigmatarchaeota archaeon]